MERFFVITTTDYGYPSVSFCQPLCAIPPNVIGVCGWCNVANVFFRIAARGPPVSAQMSDCYYCYHCDSGNVGIPAISQWMVVTAKLCDRLQK
jgi:hypothetical protein